MKVSGGGGSRQQSPRRRRTVEGARILIGNHRKVRQRNSSARGSWWSVREQVPLAVGLGLAWLGVGLWWALHGGCSRQTIDFDRASPLRAEFRVDVNTADWPELAQLPGVGETLAKRIVEYRRLHGPFSSPADVGNVPGVGSKTLNRITPYLVINAEPTPDSPAEATKGEEYLLESPLSPAGSSRTTN